MANRRGVKKAERKRRVAELFREGKNQYQIAAELHINQSTVSRYLEEYANELRIDGSVDMDYARGRVVSYLVGILNVFYPRAINVCNMEVDGAIIQQHDYKAAQIVINSCKTLADTYGLGKERNNERQVNQLDMLRDLAEKMRPAVEAKARGRIDNGND